MVRALRLLALFFPGILAAAPGPAPLVGDKVCRTCHPAQFAVFYRNPHQPHGCESCHGSGAAHVAAKGGAATIVAFSRLSPKEVLDNCLSCHAKDMSRVNIRRSAHTEADVACNSCHSIHKPATPKFLLAKVQRDVCYGCHAPVKAQFDMPSHHRVNEGVVQCTDCHNPHGSFAPSWRMAGRPRQAAQSHGNEEACLKCHSEKRGPFLFEHAALRVDGCESCHVAHGSTNSKLLTRPVVFTVCLECHNGAGTFGRTNDGLPTQSASHNMFDPRYQRCTTCHVRIHGSNADPLFLR